ncbi:MAG: hypothetical protein LBE83_01635 [Propionibacteriaceae bacterium]|jgi:hypothetical protein|nr:hypothetical protein [Propionibacteriaceae bacterium]
MEQSLNDELQELLQLAERQKSQLSQLRRALVEHFQIEDESIVIRLGEDGSLVDYKASKGYRVGMHGAAISQRIQQALTSARYDLEQRGAFQSKFGSGVGNREASDPEKHVSIRWLAGLPILIKCDEHWLETAKEQVISEAILAAGRSVMG